MAKKILLADDSLTIQKVVELTFSDSEYDLICVSNGQRALEKAAEQAPAGGRPDHAQPIGRRFYDRLARRRGR